MSISFKKKALSVFIAAGALSSVAATAQNSLTIEEIVVTAQMRSQTLQDVPMSVSAFTGEFVKDAGLTSFKDIFAVTPGVSGATADSFFDAVSVRGINNNSFGSGTDPSLGVYLDGVYQSRTGAVPTMFDMERVEVIKGPQGTLFGRNAAAGAVSMVSAKPGEEFGGEITVGAGQEGKREFDAAVDIPVTDTFRLRVSGKHEKEDGHIKNNILGTRLGGSEVDAGRVVAEFTGFEDTTITLLAQHEERESTGTVYRTLSTVGQYDEVENDMQGVDKSKITDVILTLETDIGENTLTSITGYKDHDYLYGEDFDGSSEFRDFYARDQKGKFLSQEFRLASDASNDFNWVLGASYYKEDLDADFLGATDEDLLCDTVMVVEYEYDPTDAAAATCAAWITAAAGDMIDAFGSDDPSEYGGALEEFSYTEGKNKGWGAFADMDWSLSEANSIGLGLRYTKDSKKYSVDSPWPDNWTGGWNYLPLYTDGPIQGDHSWNNVSGRLTFNHAVNDSVNTYASIATGYKSGGFNYLDYDLAPGYDADAEDYTVNSTNATPARVDEEKVTSIELGMKGKFFDDSMAVNASIFHYTYKDLQTNFESPNSGSGYITSNVGETKGKGLELDARWLMSESFEAMIGLSLLDTKFTGAPADLCATCDGNKMAFSPDYSGVIMLTYNTDVGGANLKIAGEYTFTDSQFSELENIEEIKVDAYQVFNLRATLTSPKEAWSATVYADNLFNEEYYHWGYADDGWLNFSTKTDPSRPRTIGARVSYSF